MAFTLPPANQLVNFTAAARRSRLIPFGLFSPNDNITTAIYDITGVPAALTGTIDGVNAIFTAPNGFSAIYKNGVLQLLGTMYTAVGNTITFIDPYIPQVGDYIQAIIT